MRAEGLEPSTNRPKGHRPASASPCNTTTYDSPPADLSSCLAFLAGINADLAGVVEKWPTLPAAVKAGVVALVKASADERTRPVIQVAARIEARSSLLDE